MLKFTHIDGIHIEIDPYKGYPIHVEMVFLAPSYCVRN